MTRLCAFSAEAERLGDLLRQHGTQPDDKTALHAADPPAPPHNRRPGGPAWALACYEGCSVNGRFHRPLRTVCASGLRMARTRSRMALTCPDGSAS